MADIEYRPLGKSGLIVSTVGLGCNNFGRANSATFSQQGTDAVIHAAIDAGVTMFDTADVYGAEPGLSETLMGNSLKGRRDRVVLASKFGMDMKGVNGPDWGARASRRYVRRAVEGSLTRLKTDWIDLYQIHTPDEFTPIEETLAVLDDLIVEGKIRYIGNSNFAGWQIAQADYVAGQGGHPRFISAQNEYSLLVRDVEAEVLPAVNEFGLGFLPYYPLYNGLFTGKFSRSGGPADSRLMTNKARLHENAPWAVIEEFAELCAEWKVSMLAATFGWLLAQPGVTSVIAGATKPEQVVQNAQAATAWNPTVDQLQKVSTLFSGLANLPG